MATIFVNGVFDLLHEGHQHFLRMAKSLGYRGGFTQYPDNPALHANHLIVAINSDRYAKELKGQKWGAHYPRDPQHVRAMNLHEYADQVVIFDNESELHDLIEFAMPCVICKGPDYAGKRVTGDDLAPVIILDCPEPESAKALKLQVYGQV